MLLFTKVIPPIAKVLGTTWFNLHKSRRLIAEENIKMALKYPPEKARNLALKNFIHLARVFLEFLAIPRINSSNVHEVVSLEGTNYIIEAKEKFGKICILSGHIGNWELMAYCAPLLTGQTVDIVARPQKPWWFNNLLYKVRTKTGNRLIYKKESIWSMLKTLNRGGNLAVLIDQKAIPKEGVLSEFFNKKVFTHKSLAILAYRKKCPVVPCFNLRMPNGKYMIKTLPPIDFSTYNFKEDAILEATNLFNKILEKMIMVDPTQWYWIHKRFL